ncbi:tRNA (N(6)-L-threonylcarbamoyladenosine(37)-C(2))-methylthiotransferase [archaeon]|nr:tRNA (N(6)-L-threonylcarbamoyladenosine(37)-C(2))-methylthiotransferase [archaeon]
MKAYVETYGCTLNQADSKIIEGILLKEGVELVDNPKKADIIFLNTCAVKNATENRMLSRIRKLDANKLVVCGCLPKINEKEIRKASKCVLLDTNSLDKIPYLLKERRDFFSQKHLNKLELPFAAQGIIAAIPIAEGCLGNCAFCATRNARGMLTSYPIKDIKLAVEQVIQQGAKEIRLTAEDTGFYGWDKGTSLTVLMEKLCEIPGKFKIRIGMMDPFAAYTQLPDLLKAFDNEKIYQFVHLPVQAGSDCVLKTMNRKYSASEFIEVTDAFRDKFPDMTLATDIIVGFPEETKKDFQKTLELLKQVKPEVINISMFYPRPNTPASKMKKLPTQTLKERSRACTLLREKISLQANERFVDKIFEVTVLEKGRKGGFIARLPNYKQALLEQAEIGETTKIRIIKAFPTYLKAQRL